MISCANECDPNTCGLSLIWNIENSFIFLRHYWHITLYYYSLVIMIWYMYMLQNHYNAYLTSVTIHSYNFFLMIWTFNIYSLSNFQICDTILVTIVVMLYIITFPGFIHFVAGNLYLLTPLPVSPPPHLW